MNLCLDLSRDHPFLKIVFESGFFPKIANSVQVSPFVSTLFHPKFASFTAGSAGDAFSGVFSQ